MDQKKIISLARILNIAAIIDSVVLYFVFRYVNTAANNLQNAKTLKELQEQTNKLMGIQNNTIRIVGLVGVIIIAATVFLILKNKEQNAVEPKALYFLLVGGVANVAFAAMKAMLGIIVWAVCAASLSMLKQKQAEASFENDLVNQMKNDDNM